MVYYGGEYRQHVDAGYLMGQGGQSCVGESTGACGGGQGQGGSLTGSGELELEYGDVDVGVAAGSVFCAVKEPQGLPTLEIGRPAH